MEKLSGILPNSPRVKSVDVADSHPRRPGAPSFGLPSGSTSSIRDKVTLSKNTLEEAGSDTLTYKNMKELRSAKVAQDLARNFFETRLNPTESASSRASEELADFESMNTDLAEKAASATESAPAASPGSANSERLSQAET